MRYLRQQVLNRRAPYDQRLYVDMTDSIVMNSTNNMLVPKGNGSTNRPVAPVNGMVRYNTTLNELEVYQASNWRSISFKESTKIIQQTLGPIDGYSYFYGKLDDSYSPTNISSNLPGSGGAAVGQFGGQNLLVFVGNVFQIFTTNYTITQNPTATVNLSAQANDGTTTLTFASTASIPTGSIVSGSSRFQANTTATVTSGTTVTLDKATTGGNITSTTPITFTAPAGYYLNFTSDAQYSGIVGQTITVLHGFDR